MKKIIIALVAIVGAVTVNAATVKWNVNAIQNTEGTGAASVGLYAAFFFDDAAGTIRSGIDGDTDFATLVASAAQTGATSAAGSAVRANGSVGTFNAGDTMYGFAIIFDASTIADAGNYYLTTLQNKTVAATGADVTMTWVGTNSAQGSWNVINSSAVPEPTTGLLLLLGMAGLALKRKVA